MSSLRCWSILFLAATSWGCADISLPELPPLPHYITSFGTWGTGPGEFEYPRVISVGPDSLLYITDNGNSRIQVLTPGGTFVREWPSGGYSSMIRVAPDTSVYVSLFPGQSPVHYTREGKLINYTHLWGGAQGFEIDSSGNLYSCGLRVYMPDPDHTFVEGPYLSKFNPEGELVQKWGYPGKMDTTGWSGGPMTWNPNGNLLMLGQIDSSAAVFEFTPDGETVSAWRIPNVDSYSSDIACDRDGRILISSPYQQRVYVFDSHGRLLVSFNDVSSTEEPLKMPTGIVVDRSGFIYVVDRDRYRIVKYQQAP